MNEPINVFITNPSNFDWLTFFWGGAVGSFFGASIILGLERILDYFREKRRDIHEMDLISKSLLTETVTNIQLCEKYIESMNRNQNNINVISGLKTVWLKKFCEKFIDYEDEKSLILLVLINGILSQIEYIDKIQYFCMLALNTHTSDNLLANNFIKNTNNNLIKLLKELNIGLEQLKDERIGNKIYSKEEISKYENDHKNDSNFRKYMTGKMKTIKRYFK